MEKEYIPEFYLAILLFLAHSNNNKLHLAEYDGKDLKKWLSNSIYKKYIKIVVHDSYFYIDRFASIQVLDKKHLKNLLGQYIKLFEEDKLLSSKNYYSYKNNISKCTEIWQKEYTDYGTSFAISIESLNHYNILRRCETLFSLIKNGYVKLLFIRNDIRYQRTSIQKIIFVVEFLTSPLVIADISKHWLFYGDIKISKLDGTVFYQNEIKQIKKNSYAHKLLHHLIKSPGVQISFDDINAVTGWNDAKITQSTKQKIKNLVFELKNKLGLSKNKNATLSIRIIDKSVILIPNPPQK